METITFELMKICSNSLDYMIKMTTTPVSTGKSRPNLESSLGCMRSMVIPIKFDQQVKYIFHFSITYRYSIFRSLTFISECCNHLFCCIRTCYCGGMVSMTSLSRYKIGSVMYIRGLMLRNWPSQFRIFLYVFFKCLIASF